MASVRWCSILFAEEDSGDPRWQSLGIKFTSGKGYNIAIALK